MKSLNSLDHPNLSCRRLCARRGFSLVEVLVSVGIGAILALGISGSMVNITKELKRASVLADRKNLVGELDGWLNSLKRDATQCNTDLTFPGFSNMNAFQT